MSFNTPVAALFRGGSRRILLCALLFLPLSAHAFIGILNVFVPLPGADPVAWNDADQRWLTRSSEHFTLHYPTGLETQAQHALDIAEQVHQDLVPFFGQAPKSPTVMVLEDDVDYSNGWATPLPYAQIRLFASPPDRVGGLETYDDWLHLLIRHEYVHILHMEMGSGLPAKARSVLGRHVLTFPHAMTPSFFLEGLAVYLETNPDKGYGRLQGTLYEMQMREEVASGQLASLNQVLVPNRDWPRNKAYLYGAFFIEYLVREYGEEKLQLLLTRYSERVVPYISLNSTFHRVYHRYLTHLWRLFLMDMQHRFQAEISTLQSNASSSQPLPAAPWYLQETQAHGEALYALESNGEDSQAFWRYHWRDGAAEQVEKTHLFDVQNARYFDVSSQGSLAYIRLLAHADLRVEGDIFLRDTSGDEHRLTHGLRARRLQWLPDERGFSGLGGFVVSRIHAGHSELVQVNMSGVVTPIWRGDYGDVIGDIDVSPDGSRLVASFKRSGETWNLAIFDLQQHVWRAVTSTRAIENAPVWLNAQHILFSADYDGVYNLYRYDLETDAVEQWTQESTGAFRPQKLSQRLIYQRYTANGYQLVAADGQFSQRVSASEWSGSVTFDPVTDEQAVLSTEDAYQPWSSLRPTAWYPAYYSDLYQSIIEVAIPGVDALGRHYYVLKVGHDLNHNTTPASVEYRYDNRWGLLASRSYEYDDVIGGLGDDQRMRHDQLILERRYLGHWMDDQLALHAGFSVEREVFERSAGQPWYDGSPKHKALAGLALEWTDLEAYLYVPGLGRGTHWDLVAETMTAGDFEGPLLQARGQTILDLPGRSKISLSLQTGMADTYVDRFELGGLAGDIALFGRDSVMLPGYGTRAQRGHLYTTQRVTFSHWLGNRERNWRLLPLGLGAFSGTVFVENGAAWDWQERPDWLTSVGLELHSEIILGYNWNVPLTLMVAKGLDDEQGLTSVGLSAGYRY